VPQTPLGELIVLPRPNSCIKGPTSNGREGREWGRRGRKREGRGRKGEGKRRGVNGDGGEGREKEGRQRTPPDFYLD